MAASNTVYHRQVLNRNLTDARDFRKKLINKIDSNKQELLELEEQITRIDLEIDVWEKVLKYTETI